MPIKLDDRAVMPRGFTCCSRLCGLKKQGKDLTIIHSETMAAAAGIFTTNHFPGAPVVVGREILKGGRLRTIIVNSKVSNVGTGEEGIANARRMGAAAAAEFGVPVGEVIMSSTGVIAKRLPIELIEAGVKGASREMVDDPLLAAAGIMTTDTYPKAVSARVGAATITVIAKGSGMIEPNMATMLVYILTDAKFTAPTLDRMLRAAAARSFNMLSIDTDTSTSDTCLILANGLAGEVDEAAFAAALRDICVEMTKLLARDGEGATKLLTATVSGAASEREAKVFAKSLINSPLIKTMAYGADPNIGRVLMAIGKCFDCEVVPGRLKVGINGVAVFANLAKTAFDEDELRRQLGSGHVHIDVDIGLATASATAYGCDLTEGYIKENAAYYSS